MISEIKNEELDVVSGGFAIAPEVGAYMAGAYLVYDLLTWLRCGPKNCRHGFIEICQYVFNGVLDTIGRVGGLAFVGIAIKMAN